MQPSIRGTPSPAYTKKSPRARAKNSPGHPQSTEPQQGTRASHSVARHVQHRGSTPKTVQNIRPAATKGKSDQIGSLAPPPVASLINTQPTQRLHHQATGPQGNIFAHPFGHHTFSSFSLRTVVLPILPSPSFLSPFIPPGAPQTDEEDDLQASPAWQSEIFDSFDDFESASVLLASCLQRQRALWWWM